MDVTSIFKAVFALAVVLGLILALAYGLRRYAPNVLARLSAPRGRKRLEVLETLVLDPTRRIVMVRVDDEERLILLGEGRELAEQRPLAAPKAKPAAEVAPLPVARPRPVAVAQPAPAQNAQPHPAPASPQNSSQNSPPNSSQASRAKLAAAHAAYPRPPVQDNNDDLF